MNLNWAVILDRYEDRSRLEEIDIIKYVFAEYLMLKDFMCLRMFEVVI